VRPQRRCCAEIAILILSAAAVLPAGAQTVRLTLAQCLERANAHHPRVEVAAGQVTLQRSLLGQSRAAARLPRFDTTVLLGPVPGAEGSYLDPSLRNDFGNMSVFTRVQAEFVQPLFTFGRIQGKRDAAEFGVTAAREAQAQAANEVRREVNLLYYGLLLTRTLQSVLEDATQQVATARERIEHSLESGNSEYTAADRYRLCSRSDLFRFALSVGDRLESIGLPDFRRDWDRVTEVNCSRANTQGV
jgi:outer membrane protein TolC